MLFTKYILITSIFIYTLRFSGRLLILDNGNRSTRVSFFREWSAAPYRDLRRFIDNKETRRIASMSDSGRRSFFRNKDWQMKVEPHHRKVLRLQKEALKYDAYQPIDTGSLNLDVTPLVLKLTSVTLLFSLFYTCFGIIPTSGHIYYNYITLSCIYIIYHLIISRLALRESRFWWWRPWPLLLHIYVIGLYSNRYERALYLLILPINPLVLVLCFFVFFLVEKIKQQYPLFYYRRTILYRLGALGIIILHAVLEFFFNNIWIIITPTAFIFNLLRDFFKLLRKSLKKSLKLIGIDTEKIYARFRYKLSEYRWY
jgi:hypothetical protein